MLLVLSLGTAIGILPFTIYRALKQDWFVAGLDLGVVIGMSLIFVYVYRTNNVKVASLILILVALSANVVSFYYKGISQVYWIYPAMLSAYYIMNPRKGLLINFIMLSFYIPKLVLSLEAVNVSTILVTIVITNMIAFVFASGLRKQEMMLRKLASEDYLTGTGNRRALSIELEKLKQYLKNHDRTATMVLTDLDHFKKVNDEFGHMRGDDVLVKLAGLLKSHYKNNEKIFRYGGEEFLILCPDTSLEDAFKESQSIRKLIKESIVINQNELTVSLGVAEYIKEETMDDWIRRVDLALYRAKNEGRDRVIKAE
ncbi:MAG: GGDEF domain-containing protein [Marinicellaceae bacterium]